MENLVYLFCYARQIPIPDAIATTIIMILIDFTDIVNLILVPPIIHLMLSMLIQC